MPNAKVSIGIDANGSIMHVDLDDHGPNLAVAGTTGSGKTEAIFTAVAGMAARNSPLQLQILGVDGKGGGFVYHLLDGLPHLRSVYSSDGEGSLQEFRHVLAQEMSDRRQLLIDLKSADIRELWQESSLHRLSAPPYLIVIVEEWSLFSYDMPELSEFIRGVAIQGRALGIQVIVGAQDPRTLERFPAYARIALRMYDRRDAEAFAHVSLQLPNLPGRAVLVTGEQQTLIQVATSRDGLRPMIEQMRAFWTAS